jgi:DNA-directed RNA polymerase specialized sigma24 family protein
MASDIPFAEHEKLLKFIAHKVMRRVHAAGAASIQFEDIFQELAVAWCQARDKWDQSRCVPFGPYLMRGMSHHINRWVQRELRQHTMAPFNLDAELDGEFFADNRSLHDVLPDETIASPEDSLITQDTRDYARDPLRSRGKSEPLLPETEMLLDLMESPPPALMNVIKGIQARAVYGRDTLGIPRTCAPVRLTTALVFDVMGVHPKCRKEVHQQIERLHEKVSQ